MKTQSMKMQISFHGNIKEIKQVGNNVVIDFDAISMDLWNEQIQFWIEPKPDVDRKSISGIIRVKKNNKLELKKY